MRTMIDRLLEILQDTKQGFILDRTSVKTDKSLGTIISWEDKDRLISELEATQKYKLQNPQLNLLRELRQTYLVNVDDEGQPKASIMEILDLWDRVKEEIKEATDD